MTDLRRLLLAPIAALVACSSAPDADTQAPQVALSAAPGTVTAPGDITLIATVSDDVGVVRVEVYDGARRLAEFDQPPYRHVVTVARADNGEHRYTARAKDGAGNAATSEVATVRVDIATPVAPPVPPTPPADTTRPTVSLTATPATLSWSGTVTLAATASDNVGVARVEWFDENGVRLFERTAAPYTVQVSLGYADRPQRRYTARATDAAGNASTSDTAVIAVNSPAPGFYPLGSGALSLNTNPSRNSAIAVDEAGMATVAFSQSTTLASTGTPSVFVRRWSTSGWTALGSALNNAGRAAQEVTLALDRSGTPFVAWIETVVAGASSSNQVFVRRWNGAAWTALGGALNVNSAMNATGSSIRVDESGVPTVVWTEWVSGAPALRRAHAKRWDGAAWTALGGALNTDPARSVGDAAFALDADGRPVVAWSEASATANVSRVWVKRWTGAAWSAVGHLSLNLNPNRNGESVGVALDSSGAIFVSWSEDIGGFTYGVNVKRYDNGAWMSLGGALNTANTSGYAATLQVEPGGAPVVAFTEQALTAGSANLLRVRRWNADAWTDLGAALNADAAKDASSPALALDPGGFPFVTWREQGTAPAYSTLVKRYTR
jgi:hypothetical protein